MTSPNPHNPEGASGVNHPAGLAQGMEVGGRRFILQNKLGQGGMGVVWRALDRELNVDIALKFLPTEIQADPVAMEDLRQEVTRNRILAHQHIVRVFDLHTGKNEPAFFSMEYVHGSNLSVLRLEQPGRVLPWEVVAPWIKQLCDALDYAHGEKVVHRDLKPGNLMVDHKGRLKLADFGIARVVTDSVSRITIRHGTSGTLTYMSPQQLDGHSPKCTDDIYALGATLYELLTSRPPFYTGELPYQIRHLTPVPMSQRLQELEIENDIPARVEQVVANCLAKEPLVRPQTAAQVAQRLGLFGAVPVITPPQPEPPPSKPKPRAKPKPPVPPPTDECEGTPAPPTESAVVIATEPVNTGLATRLRSWISTLVLTGLFILIVLVLCGQMGWMDLSPLKNWAKFMQTKPDSPGETNGRQQPAFTIPRPSAAPAFSNAVVVVRATPIDAKITFDDESQYLSPASFSNVLAESHHLRVERDGYEPHSRLVEVANNQQPIEITVDLVRSTGSMALRNPAGTRFVVSGQEQQKEGTVPDVLANLPTGLYEVRASLDTWGTNMAVVVRRNTVTNVDFVPPFQRPYISTAPNGAEVWIKNPQGQYRLWRTTPCSMPDMLPGSVAEFKLWLPYYHEQEEQRTIKTGDNDWRYPLKEYKYPQSGHSWTNSLGMPFVQIDRVWFGLWETRVADYSAFVRRTGHPNTEYKNPKFTQTSDNEPVVMVRWSDAVAFCEWLTGEERREGFLKANQSYRLPSDLEWSTAVGLTGEESLPTPARRSRAATSEIAEKIYPWGRGWPPPTGSGNYDESRVPDGYIYTAPVGKFPPNKQGLFDLGGNAWEWCEDDYESTGSNKYDRNAFNAPKVLRGGSFKSGSFEVMLSGFRSQAAPDTLMQDYGFRCVIRDDPAGR